MRESNITRSPNILNFSPRAGVSLSIPQVIGCDRVGSGRGRREPCGCEILNARAYVPGVAGAPGAMFGDLTVTDSDDDSFTVYARYCSNLNVVVSRGKAI